MDEDKINAPSMGIELTAIGAIGQLVVALANCTFANFDRKSKNEVCSPLLAYVVTLE